MGLAPAKPYHLGKSSLRAPQGPVPEAWDQVSTSSRCGDRHESAPQIIRARSELTPWVVALNRRMVRGGGMVKAESLNKSKRRIKCPMTMNTEKKKL